MKTNISKKMNIAVLVSGGGTNLQALIDAQKSGIITSGHIKLVISNNPNAYALKRAENAGIKTAVCPMGGSSSGQSFEDSVVKLLEENEIGLIVLAGFTYILSQKFTSMYSDRILNVHPSLIPSFCGKGFYGIHVHEKALSCGVKVTGATVHFVNEITDGGRIIMQKAVEVKDGDTPEVLQKRVMTEAEWIILPKSVEKVCSEILKEMSHGQL